MDRQEIIKIIKNKFDDKIEAKIPLINGNKYFTAKLEEEGINVNNLGGNPFLHWDVFVESVDLLKKLGGTVKKGNAMNYSLGEEELGFDTIEGYIAEKIYKKKNGDKVFRRITPIANILIWSGICKNLPGKLKLII
jgi:hypothetical protein